MWSGPSADTMHTIRVAVVVAVAVAVAMEVGGRVKLSGGGLHGRQREHAW